MEDRIKQNWQFIKDQCRFWAFKFFIDANDLHSEILERIWIKQHQFQPETGNEGFQKWVGKIIYNQCRDTYRINKRQLSNVSIGSVYDVAGSNQPSLADKDLLERITQHLRKRYNGDARIIEMAIIGTSYEDITKEMGIPSGTMKGTLNRIRKHMREQRERMDKL